MNEDISEEVSAHDMTQNMLPRRLIVFQLLIWHHGIQICFAPFIHLRHSTNTVPMITKIIKGQCRDNMGFSLPSVFNVSSCVFCYSTLFGKKGKFFVDEKTSPISLVRKKVVPDMRVYPHIHNARDAEAVCQTLTDDDCERWKSCCQQAEECCRDQVAKTPTTKSGVHCPMIWDGYGCWQDTVARKTASMSCPDFVVSGANVGDTAYKTCTSNGTWKRDPRSGIGKIDTRNCLAEVFDDTAVLRLTCNAISLLFLLPAIAIFIFYKSLRTQRRIQIHTNLFIAMSLSCFWFILWDTLVLFDLLEHPAHDEFMMTQETDCKILYFFSRMCRSTAYYWMLCEGFYLHRLMTHAFKPPFTLYGYYVFGWVGPFLQMILYTGIRVALDNDSCWLQDFPGIEWIVYAPNIICILANIAILGNILRILLTQLSKHQNEPNNFRRGLKAAILLIPLFGLQKLFIVYRLPPSADGYYEYTVARAVISNSQGIIISLLFCFGNTEVLSLLNKTLCGTKQVHKQKLCDNPEKKIRWRSKSLPALPKGIGLLQAMTKSHSVAGDGDREMNKIYTTEASQK